MTEKGRQQLVCSWSPHDGKQPFDVGLCRRLIWGPTSERQLWSDVNEKWTSSGAASGRRLNFYARLFARRGQRQCRLSGDRNLKPDYRNGLVVATSWGTLRGHEMIVKESHLGHFSRPVEPRITSSPIRPSLWGGRSFTIPSGPIRETSRRKAAMPIFWYGTLTVVMPGDIWLATV